MIYNLKLSVSSLNYLGCCACIAKSRACRPEAPDFDTPVWYSTRCTCNAHEFWIFFTENKSSAGIRKRLDIAKKQQPWQGLTPKTKRNSRHQRKITPVGVLPTAATPTVAAIVLDRMPRRNASERDWKEVSRQQQHGEIRNGVMSHMLCFPFTVLTGATQRQRKKSKFLPVFLCNLPKNFALIHVFFAFTRCRLREAKESGKRLQELARKLVPPAVNVGPQASVGGLDDTASVMQENKVKTEQIDSLNAQILVLQNRNKDLSEGGPRKKARTVVSDSAVGALLRDTFKEKVWRTIKFISSEKQLNLLTVFTLKKANLQGKFTSSGQVTHEGAAFIENYCWTVNKILNDHRSYAQNAMKDVCIAWLKDNDKKTLPKNEEFMKIITRDKKVDKDLFCWWWDQYMPRAAGSQRVWNKKIKYFGTISEHAPPGNPKDVYITPSTEAWGLLLIMNCRDRWPKLMELKNNTSNRITYTKSAASKTKAGITLVNVNDDPGFLGKYTKSDAGQKKFGGWSAEGLQLYKELVAKNKEARQKPTTKALEAEILEMLRTENDIQGDNWEEHKKLLAGETPETEAMEEIDGLFDTDELGDIEAV